MRTVKVALSTPIKMHGASIAVIEIKEPTGAQYLEFGDPRITVHLPGSAGYLYDQPAVIEKYFDACLMHDADAATLKLLSLGDAMRVKEALLGFFSAATAPASPPRSTSSSSP